MSHAVDPYFESQFNLRSRHPDHERFKALWAERSAQARLALPARLDLPCGVAPGAKFDLFSAEKNQSRGAPCLLFLHGGFWRASDKSDCSFVALPLVPQGIATVVLNYTLAPRIGIAEIVEEVRQSVAYVYLECHHYGIDRTRLFLGGYSAGAHLAAMVLATDWAARGFRRPLVRDGMGLSGIYDPSPLVRTSHNVLLQLDAREASKLSTMKTHASAPRLTLIAYGEDDTEEFKRQSSEYAEATKALGHEADLVKVPARNHYDVLLELADARSALVRVVTARIRRPRP